MARLFIIFVAYGSAGSHTVGRYLHRLAHRFQPSALVVVDNAGRAAAWQLPGVTVIDGDNQLREFSGWDRGVAWLRQRHDLGAADWLLFINDTVCRQTYLRWLTLGRGQRLVKRLMRRPPGGGPDVIGPLVRSGIGEPWSAGGAQRCHLATFFFLLPYRVYADIGGLGVGLPWQTLIGSVWPQALFNLPGEAARTDFYNAWLGCGQAGGRGQWSGSQERPFNAANYNFLRGKAQCILLESRLSAALARRSPLPTWAIDLYPTAPWSRILQWALRRFDGAAASLVV